MLTFFVSAVAVAVALLAVWLALEPEARSRAFAAPAAAARFTFPPTLLAYLGASGQGREGISKRSLRSPSKRAWRLRGVYRAFRKVGLGAALDAARKPMIAKLFAFPIAGADPVTDVERLRHKRADELDGMRALTEKAESEDRDLTGEEKQEYERREGAFDELTSRIERVEKESGLGGGIQRSDVGEAETREVDEDEQRNAPESFREFNEQRRGVKPQDEPEYREAYFKWITIPDVNLMSQDELRVLSKATAGAGLNLVPSNFQKDLIIALRDFGAMRELADVITTENGEELPWPTVTGHGSAAWVAENGSYTASDETFGLTPLKAFKAGTLIKVSEELMSDSAFDLDAYIRNEFGERIGVLENTGYVAGDGSGKPTGVVTQASAGVTAAGAAAITADELIDLFYSLRKIYRRNGAFLANDSTLKLIRKLKDSDGQYIWQAGLQAGQPRRPGKSRSCSATSSATRSGTSTASSSSA
jgi:HK97 family phage major capsid protein